MAGIHLATPGLAAPPKPWSPAERAHFAHVDAWTGEEGGYAQVHSTKPAALGAALHDSPAGLAAWIGEKIAAWSSTTAGGQPAFPQDLLLGTLTLYWATGTITSSLLPYWAYRHRARQRAASRRAISGTHGHHRLQRRAGPLSQAATRAGRALLPRHRLGRARPRWPLPRRRPTATARRNTARRLPATTGLNASAFWDGSDALPARGDPQVDAGQPVILSRLVAGLDDQQIRARPAPGEWAVIEVVAHMADVDERAHARLERMLAEDNPVLPAFDQDALAGERGYITMDLATELARYRQSRTAHLASLEALDVGQWRRPGRHETAGDLTVELYEAHVAAEDVDHLAQIARLAGPTNLDSRSGN